MDRSVIFQDSFSDSNKSPRILKGFSSHFRILQGFFRILIPFQGIFMDSSGILQDSFSYSNKSPRIFRDSYPISRYLQPSFRIFFFSIPRDYQGFSRILNDPQPMGMRPVGIRHLISADWTTKDEKLPVNFTCSLISSARSLTSSHEMRH